MKMILMAGAAVLATTAAAMPAFAADTADAAKWRRHRGPTEDDQNG